MTIRKLILITFIFMLPVACLSQKKAELKVSEFITDNPPFASCHASTIAELPGNRLIAAWFAGSYESHNDVTIWMAIRQDGKWQAPVVVADGVINDTLRYPCWNPVLFRTREGKLFLFYKTGRSPREWWGMKKVSGDNGKTWSAAEKLPDGQLGPIKNKPVQLKDGSILYPSSTESMTGDKWKIHMERSDKDGLNWRKIEIDNDTFNAIQPSVLIHKDGRLQLLCRSREGYIVESWSSDQGQTWSKLSKTKLPNPNSGTDAVTLRSGQHVLIYNPIQRGRNKLNVAISPDGINWSDLYVLENESQGEFSYPAVIQSADGLLHITYTYQRKKIRHVALSFK